MTIGVPIVTSTQSPPNTQSPRPRLDPRPRPSNTKSQISTSLVTAVEG